MPFDSGWRFLKGDAPGAEQSGFDDVRWRALDVPHDWSIEGPFDEKNPTGGAGAFLPAGRRLVSQTLHAARRPMPSGASSSSSTA